MGGFVPTTADERREMLDFIGAKSIEQLYSDVPEAVLLKELNLPDGKSELETASIMSGYAAKNTVFRSIFRGAGVYNHYIPSAVKNVISKEEFLTAYTPYQAEISQGILQSIFEYQTMICELTGMSVANASVYDGATAAAEAVAMCVDRNRKKAFVSGAVNPEHLAVMKTYCFGSGTELVVIPEKDGATDIAALTAVLDGATACVYVEQPNYFGLLEDIDAVSAAAHAVGAKCAVGCNPISLGMLKTPAECGADIACGEGQPLGMPLSFGGPYLGFMATTDELMRRLPGRIVGETSDAEGRRAFVLTLQAREQHIRREKASSNICSNEALCALTAAVYLSCVGPDGLKQAAGLCHSKAVYLSEKLSEISEFERVHNGEFFNEFVTGCPVCADKLCSELEKRGILAGLPIDKGILWCTTEMNTKQQIDELVDAVKEVCAQ